MRRKHFRRVLALVTALTVAIGLTVPAAYAASASEFDSSDGQNSIIVKLSTNIPKSVRENLKINIYKVADAKIENGYVKYTKTTLFRPDFSSDVSDAEPDDNENYKEDNNGIGNVSLTSTKDKWPDRAKTLAGYTVKKNFNTREGFEKNHYSPTLDADAKTATKTDLKNGLYLITIDSITSGRTTYNFTPILRCLPSLDQEGKKWEAVQRVDSKYDDPTSGGGNSGDSPISIKVRKDWKDEGQKSDRPESVTVELLRNGKSYGGTKKLDESGGWTAIWNNLPSSGTYVVNEISISDKYTVLANQEGNTWVITNTHTTDIEDPDTPLDPGPGGDPGTGGDIPPTNIDDPDVPLDPGRTPGDNATNIKDPASPANAAKLPQTGQLWWPVPILAVAGIAFFSIGWLRSRKDESEENK